MNKVNSFRKKNLFQKLWLKAFDYDQYKLLKRESREIISKDRRHDSVKQFLATTGVLTSEKISKMAEVNHSLNFSHSGNAGDIIYALPTVKKIFDFTAAKINIYLKIDQKLQIPSYFKHPLGNVMLNDSMSKMLIPLLASQEYINHCGILSNETIDINLDDFRKSGISLSQGDIARWCSYLLGVTPELHKPWLKVPAETTYQNSIVIARSERYRNPLIDYSFLNKYDDLVFIGVRSEYDDIKKSIPKIKWKTVDSFLHLAQLIAGCKFFIGNQSFPYSVAEGLKVPRILEICFFEPNVIPSGDNAFDIYFQEHFESVVCQLNRR